jgi:hypothetical protein
MKPAKVSKEDMELADEIGLVTAIKEAVEIFSAALTDEFFAMEAAANTGHPVAVYKQILAARQKLAEGLTELQATLLVRLGDIEPEDAQELSSPDAAQTAGTMDAALESKEPVVEIHAEEN